MGRGQIAWLPAAVLAVGFAAGGEIGARLAVRGGERLIRPVLGLAVLALADAREVAVGSTVGTTGGTGVAAVGGGDDRRGGTGGCVAVLVGTDTIDALTGLSHRVME